MIGVYKDVQGIEHFNRREASSVKEWMPMSIAKWVYTPSQVVTISLASLASGDGSISSSINNTSTGYFSIEVQLQIRTGSSSSSGGLYGSSGVGLYLLRTCDGNPNSPFFDSLYYTPGGATAAIPDLYELILILFTPNTSSTYVASARIENLSQIFKFAVFNGTEGTLDTNSANFSLTYVAKTMQRV